MDRDLPKQTPTTTLRMVQTPSLNIGYEQTGPTLAMPFSCSMGGHTIRVLTTVSVDLSPLPAIASLCRTCAALDRPSSVRRMFSGLASSRLWARTLSNYWMR
jgi:hypothetical protein